jgi:hypothetical protein
MLGRNELHATKATVVREPEQNGSHMMKRAMLASLILGLAVSAASGWQETIIARDGQAVALGAAGDRSQWFERMLDRFANQLELDEAQRAQFDELAGPYHQRMQDMGRRWGEMRQAMRDGDQERVAALRAEMDPSRGPGSVFTDLLDEVAPLLREDQLDRLYEMQDRMEGQRRQGEMYHRLMTDLPRDLNLDETQRERWDELMASGREQQRQRWQEMRARWEEAAALEDAGDQEGAQELREQLRQEMRPDPTEMLSAFFEQLEKVLRDDQKAVLEDFRQEFGIGREGDVRGGRADVRTIIRAARRVRLSSEQRDELRMIERDAMQARREIRRRDAEGQALLAAKVKKQVVELLDPEQTREFEEHLQRLDRRSRSAEDNRPTRTP